MIKQQPQQHNNQLRSGSSFKSGKLYTSLSAFLKAEALVTVGLLIFMIGHILINGLKHLTIPMLTTQSSARGYHRHLSQYRTPYT